MKFSPSGVQHVMIPVPRIEWCEPWRPSFWLTFHTSVLNRVSTCEWRALKLINICALI